MLKKVFALAVVVGACSVPAFAQVVDDPSQYTSGAAEPATPKVTINHVPSEEPIFNIAIHPMSLAVYPILLDKAFFYLTIEGCINSNASIITRPYFKMKNDENTYKGKEYKFHEEDVELMVAGISEGFRYYFNRGHRGVYAAFHVSYDYVSAKYSYDDSSYDFEDSGNNIGVGFYLGEKHVMGSITMSFDAGVTYNNLFVKSKTKDDVEDMTSDGVDFDFNWTLGFAF